MLIMGHPQFETQDDAGIGDGIPPIPEWQLGSAVPGNEISHLGNMGVDRTVSDVLIRLRNVFHRAQHIPFPPTQFHDLTCFVVHRLLLSAPNAKTSQVLPIFECVRYAIILYLLIIQGPTYYSHDVLLDAILTQFMEHLERFESTPHESNSLDTWLLAIGMVASTGTPHYPWFVERASAVAALLQLHNWNNALVRIKSVLWLETLQGENIFRPHWDVILDSAAQRSPFDVATRVSPSNTVWYL